MSKLIRGMFKRRPVPVPDTTPPSAPGTPTAALVGNQPSLTWSASTDNVAVKGYQVWRRNTASGVSTQIANVPSNAFVDATAGIGTWAYKVNAYDSATPPNVSAFSAESSSVTVTSPVDVTAPNVPAQPTLALVDNTKNPPTYTITFAPVTDIDPGDGSPISGTQDYLVFHGTTQQPGSIPTPSALGSTTGLVIGAGSLTGSDTGTVISATGDGLDQHWSTADEFYTQFEPVQGAGQRFWKITAITNTTPNAYPKRGLELRGDLSAGSAYANLLYFGPQGVKGEQRVGANAQAAGGAQIADPGMPLWLRLTWTASWLVTRDYSTNSTNGTDGTWITYDTIQMAFGTAAFVGRFVSCNTIGGSSGSVSATYSNYGGSGAPAVSYQGVGAQGLTIAVSVKARDKAGNVSAASTPVLATFSAAAPVATDYYPRFSSYPISGSRNHATSTFQLRASKDRAFIYGIWPGFDGDGVQPISMAAAIAAIKALNPNTKAIAYFDVLNTTYQPSGGANQKLSQTLDANHYWAYTSYPNGSKIGFALSSYPNGYIPNVFDPIVQQFFADFESAWMVKGDPTGIAGGTNVPNPNINGFYQDDCQYHWSYASADMNKDGSADTVDAAFNQTLRNSQMAILNKIQAENPGCELWGNLSQFGANGASTVGYTLAGGVCEGQIGETWSPDTWGSASDMNAFYDQSMAARSGSIGVYVHVNCAVNGSDPYDSTPYRASAYGFAHCFLGTPSGTGDLYQTASYDTQDHVNWFDEYAVDANGHAVTLANESASNGRGYLGAPVTSRTNLGRGAQGLWIREYAHGFVVWNPKNNGSQSILPSDVGGTAACKFILGNQETTRNSGNNFTTAFSMPARSGLVLLKRANFGG